jgi:uncharacterized membrane protein YtjA (UPF0391 family)
VKHFSISFIALAVICGVFGFSILNGALATIFQILFVGFFIMAILFMIRSMRVKKPVRSSFAASFRSEPPRA